MEVYFKNLTSEESPTEKLVEDVMMLVNETENLVKTHEATLGENAKAEITTALERVKNRCLSLRSQTLAGARQTDRLVRDHPYAAIGAVFGVGLLLGFLVARRSPE